MPNISSPAQMNMTSRRICLQVNLQQSFGGGEVYTGFFTRALLELGYEVVLFVSRRSEFWEALLPAAVELVRVDRPSEIMSRLPPGKSLVVTHTTLDAPAAKWVAQRHRLCGFVHMPVYERNPAGFSHYHLLFPVSRHVLASMRQRGYGNVYPQPIYGIADPSRASTDGAVVARSEYDWDRRKLRDRLLGLTEPWWRWQRAAVAFSKRPGLTLGIVSRLTPIKQFPTLFACLAPIIAKFTQVNLEIFGSGGYASVRDLRASLGPMLKQVRFWGHQPNVASVYRQLDFVLSGLPEKEALGLNLIEAQYCGTPVLAVRAPPFTETVIDEKGGFLYTDPRDDHGADFERLLGRLLSASECPRPQASAEHLAEFGAQRFRERVALALQAAAAVAT